jgi:hypothetical protein
MTARPGRSGRVAGGQRRCPEARQRPRQSHMRRPEQPPASASGDPRSGASLRTLRTLTRAAEGICGSLAVPWDAG